MPILHFDNLKDKGDTRGFQNATVSKMSCISKTNRAIKILLTASLVSRNNHHTKFCSLITKCTNIRTLSMKLDFIKPNLFENYQRII